MFEIGAIKDKVQSLISDCAQLSPAKLARSSQLKELSALIIGVPSENCEEIAATFHEACTGFDENHKSRVDTFQRVLILSLVEKMNFPDSNQAEGFHYWADKCSCELIDIGGGFFEQEDDAELNLVLNLMEEGCVSNFAQTSLIKSLYVLESSDMRALLNTISHPLVWMGAFANSEFARSENVPWLIENHPNFEAVELIALIEESPIGSIAWEYPFLLFSREVLVTDDVIEYLIKILENDYIFRNKNEGYIASAIIEYEDENDLAPERLLARAIEICESNVQLRTAGQNSSLHSLVQGLVD
jgi:hypothetical protein